MDNNFISLKGKKNKLTKILITLVVLSFIFLYFSSFFISHSKKDVYIHISYGESISSITSELKNKGVIENSYVFRFFMKLFGFGNHIGLGDYLIKKGSSIWSIAWQIGNGKHNVDSIKITLREGLTNEQIADILADKIDNFNRNKFLLETINKQGYLFPDTYFFFPMDTTDEIIKKLSDNFNNKIKNLENNISNSGKSLKDIITMASILEGEASGKEDASIISGILWKRLSMGMPLQVDIDKDTYDNKGLPSEPLNNPGLISIKASIFPKETSYLYYIHDENGQAHFSENFTEHKKNISKYLK